jgi:tRNA nucleotidyltransferase (CCA-adding enzyme)
MLDQCYRVGGFVRDTLLGLEPQDIDYVVIGESPDSMLSKGFTRVGHSFPVFLHPETQDEYALGRSEISIGDGHSDFLYDWSGVTLEQDLKRRDCTINAMAMLDDGSIFDPYGGQKDLASGILRHVSPSFAEDPLRVLRVARFAARYGYVVAPETLTLMAEMTSRGMLDALTAERVWQETEKALLTSRPSRYFEVLDECGALEKVFPELFNMKGIPQAPAWHAEGDVWVHSKMVLDEAQKLSSQMSKPSRIRILAGALFHDLGKTTTPRHLLWAADGTMLGKHHGHEDPDRFKHLLEALAERVCMPKDIQQFVYACALGHQDAHRIKEMGGNGLAGMYARLGLDRQLRHDPEFLDDFLVMCEADNYGRLITLEDGSLHKPDRYSQADYVREAMKAIASVKPGPIMQYELGRGRPMSDAKDQVLAQQRRVGNAFKKAKRAAARASLASESPEP